MKPTKAITAELEVRRDPPLQVDLRVINTGAQRVFIHNPGHYKPTAGWNNSIDAYRIAVLVSFHFLEMTLRTEAGVPIAPKPIATRADHDVDPAIELRPGARLEITIPLGEFYDLASGSTYRLELTYGDDTLRVSATTEFQAL